MALVPSPPLLEHDFLSVVVSLSSSSSSVQTVIGIGFGTSDSEAAAGARKSCAVSDDTARENSIEHAAWVGLSAGRPGLLLTIVS